MLRIFGSFFRESIGDEWILLTKDQWCITMSSCQKFSYPISDIHQWWGHGRIPNKCFVFVWQATAQFSSMSDHNVMSSILRVTFTTMYVERVAISSTFSTIRSWSLIFASPTNKENTWKILTQSLFNSLRPEQIYGAPFTNKDLL